MKKLFTILFAVLLVSISTQSISAQHSVRDITINIGNSQTHTNFPMVLKIWHGDTIHFTDHNCNKIHSEFVNDSIVWLQIDSLRPGNNTFIMHGFIDSSTHWNEKYKAIWHMEDTTDSGIFNNHLNAVGAPEATAGNVSGAYKFNKDSLYRFVAPADSSMLLSSGITCAFWVRFDSESDFIGISGFFNKDSTFTFERYKFQSKISYSFYSDITPVENQSICAPPLVSGQCWQFMEFDTLWHYMIITKSLADTAQMISPGNYAQSQDMRMYYDGYDVIYDPISGFDTIHNAMTDFVIGMSTIYGNNTLIGTNTRMDEVFFIDERVNEDWAMATFYNQLYPANFFTISSPYTGYCYNYLDVAEYNIKHREESTDNSNFELVGYYNSIGQRIDPEYLADYQYYIEVRRNEKNQYKSKVILKN